MTKKFLRVLAGLTLPACTIAMVACNGFGIDGELSSSEKSETSANVDSTEPTPAQSSENLTTSEPAESSVAPVTPDSSESTSIGSGEESSTGSESTPEASSEESSTSSEPVHEHTFNQEVATEDYLASPATCTEKAKYFYSCVCGEKGSETFEYGEPLGHGFATIWSYDDTNHWHAATCGHTDEKKDLAPHVFTVAEDGLSKSCECGYTVDCIVDVDVLLEAEDAVLNPAHISIDENAHGGKYALGFDNCGQGMYFRYFAYEDGEKEVDVAYATNCDYAYMTMFVNGGTGIKVTFSEKTGWFGDSHQTAVATVNANFTKGWNEIYLIKNGTEAEDWGQYAQIDYIKIKGSGKDFTGQEFDRTVNSFKLEAEMAAWHYANAGTRPIRWDNNGISLNFGLGEMNAVGDGVKFVVKAAYTGTYKVRLAYGADSNTRDISVYINDELVNENKPLENGTERWNDIKPDNSGITLPMEKGETYTIDFQRGNSWFVADYLLLELVK